jgi:hypothetical protein
MRKFLVSLAAAGTALAFATPAAAQYYPQPQGYAYGSQPYGTGYGYNSYGQVRALQARIDGIQRQVEVLRDRRMISRNEAEGLRHESRDLERRLYRSSGYGLNYREVQDISYRVARLERHVQHEVADGGRWGRGYGYNNYGYNSGYFADRDDDRWEHDRDGWRNFGRDNDQGEDNDDQ